MEKPVKDCIKIVSQLITLIGALLFGDSQKKSAQTKL